MESVKTDDNGSFGGDLTSVIRKVFAERVPWRARVTTLSLFVGLSTGVVCFLYDTVMEFCLELVWKQGGPLYASYLPEMIPSWTYILVVCTVLGGLVCMPRLPTHFIRPSEAHFSLMRTRDISLIPVQ